MDPFKLKLLQAGNKRIYEEVYNDWYKRVYRFCYKRLGNELDAEDVTAATMLFIWINRKKFTTPEHFENYVYLFARHRCIDVLKKKKEPARGSRDLNEAEHQIDSECVRKWNRTTTATSVLGIIDIGINKLEPDDKALLELYYHERLKPAAIAMRLNTPIGTIYDRLRRAKDKLRIALQEEGFTISNLIILITLINIF